MKNINEVQKEAQSLKNSGVKKVRLYAMGERNGKRRVFGIIEFYITETPEHYSSLLKSGKFSKGIRNFIENYQEAIELKIEAIDEL